MFIYLSNSFDSVQTIKSYIQAIKQFHIISGYDVTPFEGIRLQLALRGLARTISKHPRQAQPLSTDILLAIHPTLNSLLPNNVVFWCILIVDFFLFARISNLVKTGYTEFHIKRGQVIWSERLMLLNFTRTKTLQYCEKVLKIPVLANPSSKLCQVSAYKDMVRTIPAPSGGVGWGGWAEWVWVGWVHGVVGVVVRWGGGGGGGGGGGTSSAFKLECPLS